MHCLEVRTLSRHDTHGTQPTRAPYNPHMHLTPRMCTPDHPSANLTTHLQTLQPTCAQLATHLQTLQPTCAPDSPRAHLTAPLQASHSSCNSDKSKTGFYTQDVIDRTHVLDEVPTDAKPSGFDALPPTARRLAGVPE